MSLKNLFFVTLALLFFQEAISQRRRFEEYNLLGVNGGATFFDIQTDNFTTEQGTGFFGGFTTRGTVYEALDLIYQLSFFNNEVGVLGRDPLNPVNEQFLDYTISAAQLSILASVNLIRHHLTIELGPTVSVNGKMKLNTSGTENYILDGYSTLRASDIEQISKVNFNVLGGVSTGVRNFRLSGHYQYGITNMFSALNDRDLENTQGSFSGNSSMFMLSGTIYF